MFKNLHCAEIQNRINFLSVDHHRNSDIMYLPCTLAFISSFQPLLNKSLPTGSQSDSVTSGFISDPSNLQLTDKDISICLWITHCLISPPDLRFC